MIGNEKKRKKKESEKEREIRRHKIRDQVGKELRKRSKD
jgi:hypothetical protein